MRNILAAAACTAVLLTGSANAPLAADEATRAGVLPSLAMVRIYVVDMAKSERFYQEVLKLNVAAKLSEEEHALMFPGASGGPGILLLQANAETPEANGAIVVRVGDVDAVVARAVALGGKVVRPAQSGPQANTRYAMFNDFDGTLIQVSQFSPEEHTSLGAPASKD